MKMYEIIGMIMTAVMVAAIVKSLFLNRKKINTTRPAPLTGQSIGFNVDAIKTDVLNLIASLDFDNITIEVVDSLEHNCGAYLLIGVHKRNQGHFFGGSSTEIAITRLKKWLNNYRMDFKV